MSGMGSSYAGSGLAGADILALSAPIAPMANAAQYDPRLRVIATNADGSVATVHPVDQSVAYCLTIAVGTIASDPKRGMNWPKFRASQFSARQRAATDMVNVALAALIARGDVTVMSVELHGDSSRVSIVTNYRNNRLTNSPQTSFTSTFTQ